MTVRQPDDTTVGPRDPLSQTCPTCGLTEARGAYCTSCCTPRHSEAWDAPSVAPALYNSHSPNLHQRCLRCGTEEAAGRYCTWCRTAEYQLVEHRHPSAVGGAGGASCPLGPYLNPSSADNRTPAAQRRLVRAPAAWDASHDPAEYEPYITRRWTHQARVTR